MSCDGAPGGLEITESLFGKQGGVDGISVHRYDCSNGRVRVSLLDFGATLFSVQVPDRDGKIEEVTLNVTSLDQLLHKNMYFGSTVGRVANRVANGRFTLDGKVYTLAKNNEPNHLHGGKEGFDQKIWKAHPFISASAVGVCFILDSPDGEEGYPGNVAIQVTYSLLASEDVLEMDVKAETDAATPLALSNHAYWNLSGNLKNKIYDHKLRVAASSILEVGPHQIPTGVFQPVLQTPFDLRAEEGIILGDRIQQIDGGGKPGFDHCFVVDGYDRAASREKSEHVRDAEDEVHEKGSPESWIRARARFMATLVDPKSGRAMDVRGTQPGLQVYTANWLDEEDGQQHAAVCLETEFFPNAVNDPKAGCVDDVILRPGQIYRHFTSHRFYNLPKP